MQKHHQQEVENLYMVPEAKLAETSKKKQKRTLKRIIYWSSMVLGGIVLSMTVVGEWLPSLPVEGMIEWLESWIK
jgi:hypothetical protein